MIAAVVIDTNVYSGFRRGLPDCVEVFSTVPRVPLVVIAELYAGFAAGRRADVNRAEFGLFLSSSRVSPHCPDLRTAEIYGQVFRQFRKDGQPFPTNDLWVAACALQVDALLVSLDRHFTHVAGLRSASTIGALLGS